MINQFGADSVRWFILSDSPPDKDIQWSATGVEAANKFLQKVWTLNFSIANRKDKKINKVLDKKFTAEINIFINKIDEAIKNFRLNVSIAYFYQIYKIIKDSMDNEIINKLLKDNLVKIMKLMTPFTPHLSFECLELLKCETMDKWPELDKENINAVIKLAVQINGKTRDIISIKSNLSEKDVNLYVIKNSKAKKYLEKSY